MGGPNWSNLVEQGRAKSFGVPWTDEEAQAVFKLKIPADLVREGVLTLEDYEKVKNEIQTIEQEGNKKPLKWMSRSELLIEAGMLGIQVSSETPRYEIIHLISQKLKENQLPAVKAPVEKKPDNDGRADSE